MGDRAGTCRGTAKVPIEGLLRSQGPIRGTSSMLALLALPLLAMPARGQVEDRSLLEDLIEDLEQHQYPDYQQYNDQVYDGEPAPARALHQDDLRAATRQGRQIKSSMLPAYCDPPNPCPLGYTARMAALRILKTTPNSLKSTRLLKTACVILNTCLHALNPNSRMTEDFHSLEVSRQWRKSRILSLLEPSCQLPRRREWATRSSLPSLTPATPSTCMYISAEDKKEAGSQYLYPPETKKAQITDTNVGYSPSSTMWGTQVFQLFVLSPVSDQFQQLVL